MERVPVRSVNLGTGESGMHPDFKAILAYLQTKPVKLTITSNGHSVAVLEDNELRAFHDIELSLDYPTQAEQDAQRGPGNWALINQQAERCVRLDIPVTVIAVMMKSNYLRLGYVARVAKQFDAPLRVNVYQAVTRGRRSPDSSSRQRGEMKVLSYTSVPAIGTYRLFSTPGTYFIFLVGWRTEFTKLKALLLITSVNPVRFCDLC